MINEIWKVRCVKSYPEARNHILIGRVVHRDQSTITLNCKTYHFGSLVNGEKDVEVGALDQRIIPWVRVEIVNVLDEDFSYQTAKLKCDSAGNVILAEGKKACMIACPRERKYR